MYGLAQEIARLIHHFLELRQSTSGVGQFPPETRRLRLVPAFPLERELHLPVLDHPLSGVEFWRVERFEEAPPFKICYWVLLLEHCLHVLQLVRHQSDV